MRNRCLGRDQSPSPPRPALRSIGSVRGEGTHCGVRHRTVWSGLKRFEEQLFRSHTVFIKGTAPSLSKARSQYPGQADPSINGLRINLQRLLEKPSCLCSIGGRYRAIPPRSSPHDEISGISVGGAFPLNPTPEVPGEFGGEGPRQTTGN